jgi:hypothetical protein
MKKIYFLLAVSIIFAACQQKTTTDTAKSTTAPEYPYQIKDPNNWIIDTAHTNTLTALQVLKAFETMDTTTMKQHTADSVIFNYDGGVFKGSSGQFAASAYKMAKTMKDLKLKVTDWESVTGKTKKEEWVTVWYVQYWTNSNGKDDSVQLVNDFQFKAGKVVQLDEYARHFTPPVK